MNKIKSWLNTDDNRTIVLTGVSVVFLLFSIFTDIKPFGINMAWGAILISGTPIVFDAGKRLLTKGDINAGVLVSIAVIACIAIGEYFAAGEVVVIMMIGEILEDYTVRKSKMGLRKLIELKPTTARVLRGETYEMVDTTQINVGDRVRIIAGENVPVDGVVLEGTTDIEQAVMTGESVPVYKAKGDEVFCATTNLHGSIDIEATKVGEDSSISRMIRMVKEAEDKKAPILSVMDRWATYLVIIALALSLIIAMPM